MKNKIYKKNKPKILIIVSTHGNEKIGLEVVKKLENRGFDKFFDVLIANPKASEMGVRFLDKDMNRSYTGDKNSENYEEKQAYYNLEIAKSYKYVIDLHEADCGYDDFIIIPKKRMPKFFPVNLVDMDKLLFWPDPKGPISEVLENAIELEFGSRNRDRKKMLNKLRNVLENFIDNIYNEKKVSYKKETYYVYDKLMKEDLKVDIKEMRDFKKIKNGDEEFLPLLTNQYIDYGIICYKMR